MMHLQCVKIGVDYQENYYTTSFVYKNGVKLIISRHFIHNHPLMSAREGDRPS